MDLRKSLDTIIDDILHKGVRRPLLAVAVASGAAFVALTVEVVRVRRNFPLERDIEKKIQQIDWGPAEVLHTPVSYLAGVPGMVVGAAAIAVVYRVDRRATPLIIFGSMGSVAYQAISIVVRRPRPTGLKNTTPDLAGYGYPSGHVAFFVWMGVLLVVIFARRGDRRVYAILWALALALIIFGSLSRMYVGAHWASDILGGLLLGIFWVTLGLALRGISDPVLREAAVNHRRRTMALRSA
ncbi:MAG: phosphatase PAP2 family protein [Candidatus Dormibacteria bacterium]